MGLSRAERARIVKTMLDGENDRDRQALMMYLDGHTHTAIWCALKYDRLREVQDLCARYKAHRGSCLPVDLANLDAINKALD